MPFKATPGHEKLQILQDAWTSCKGEWKKSSLFLSIRHRKKCSTHGARVWLTRAQICAKYGGDQAVADDICNNKLMDPELAQSHVKSHPDAPNSEARNVYYQYTSTCLTYDNAYRAYQTLAEFMVTKL